MSAKTFPLLLSSRDDFLVALDTRRARVLKNDLEGSAHIAGGLKLFKPNFRSSVARGTPNKNCRYETAGKRRVALLLNRLFFFFIEAII